MQQVIGYAIIVWVWTNEFGSDILWIDEIVVDENYRGQGLGTKFFSWLETTYGDSPAFSLLVSEHNHKAKRLYEEIGFKSVQTQMLKANNIIKMTPAATSIREFVRAV